MNIFDKAKKKRKGGGGKGSSDTETDEEIITAPEVDEVLEMLNEAIKTTSKIHNAVTREISRAEERERKADAGFCRC